MDLATIVLAAAEGAEHAEKSHTAFYLAGGALAVFAVVIGVLGIKKHDLGEGPSRAIMAIGTVLVVATLVASIATS
jgi:hypothetical protein